MSASSNERRARGTSCGSCGTVRPKGARWKWCHHCEAPTPFCPSCWPHHHHLVVRASVLELEADGSSARAFSLEAEGSPALVAALLGLGPLAGPDGEDLAAAEELVRRELELQRHEAAGPVKPDRILPPAFCRLGETIKR